MSAEDISPTARAIRAVKAQALRDAAAEAAQMAYPASQDPAHWAAWLNKRADELEGGVA